MDAHEALVGLNLVADIGSIRLRRLIEIFGSAQRILKASVEQLTQVDGIGQGTAARIAGLDPGAVDKEFVLAARAGIKILTVESAEYPKNLKFIPDPPIVLYRLSARAAPRYTACSMPRNLRQTLPAAVVRSSQAWPGALTPARTKAR